MLPPIICRLLFLQLDSWLLLLNLGCLLPDLLRGRTADMVLGHRDGEAGVSDGNGAASGDFATLCVR